jgi:very-short-patch-repair endonuclease
MRRIPPEDTARARALRNNPTPAEVRLWQVIARYRPAFTRQLKIGPYDADMACRTAKLIVELDGSQHVDAERYDAARTVYLEAQGWVVLRFWNNDVMSNTDGVVKAIMARAAECLGGTHPQPLPSREGRIRRPRYL